MLGFAVLAVRLGAAVRDAWRDRTFRGAALNLVLLVAMATAFYRLHEGWSMLGSLYFSVTTGLTLGYGDLAPSTDASRVFTMAYALCSVGLFVTVGGLLARSAARQRPPVRHRRR